MPFIVVIVLGIIQGLTEFLPVSSSGHLVVAQSYLPGFTEQALPFDVLLHFGTLLALFIYFFGDIKRITLSFFRYGGENERRDRRLGLLIIVGSIPAAIVGIFFEDQIGALFENARVVPYMFLITAALLLIAERIAGTKKDMGGIGVKEALIIGIFQAVAIVPGISRSGSTIAGGLMTGLERETAARFSFLLSIPAVFGAFVLSLGKIAGLNISYVIGAGVSCLVGLLAIWLTFRFVVGRRLWVFSAYLVVLAVALIVVNHV
jgi:undecaprenyl-diphosphatase